MPSPPTHTKNLQVAGGQPSHDDNLDDSHACKKMAEWKMNRTLIHPSYAAPYRTRTAAHHPSSAPPPYIHSKHAHRIPLFFPLPHAYVRTCEGARACVCVFVCVLCIASLLLFVIATAVVQYILLYPVSKEVGPLFFNFFYLAFPFFTFSFQSLLGPDWGCAASLGINAFGFQLFRWQGGPR